MKVRFIHGLVLAMMASTGSARAAMIINGGFEIQTPTPVTLDEIQSYSTGSTNISGWTVLGPAGASGRVSIVGKDYVSAGIDYEPNSGNYWLDITGLLNSGVDRGVRQVVATIPDQAYQLSFFVGRAVSGSDDRIKGNASVALKINGTDVPTSPFTNSRPTPAGFMTWERFSYDFTGIGSSTTIDFLNATPSSQSIVAGLDDVSLVAVPEPATLASASLAAIGTGIAWLLLRRRQSSEPSI